MKALRMIIDSMMIILLPLLMAYSLVGEYLHEVLGICMFALFIAHNVINRKWWTSVFKGKYDLNRVIFTTVNVLLALYMFIQPLSGILMSKYVLKGITIKGYTGLFRTVHMTGAYWGFILMSFHLGLNASAFVSPTKKHMNKTAIMIITAVFLLISVYGVYAFVSRRIGDYLTMKTMFAFFDPNSSTALFLIDYVAVMILVAVAAFWLRKSILKCSKKKEGKSF